MLYEVITKHGCFSISIIAQYFKGQLPVLHIFIADRRMVLFVLNHRIDNLIEQLLCACVAQVFDALSANAVVNRESASRNNFV